MKRFFVRAPKPPPLANNPPAVATVAAPPPVKATGLQPKYVVPPMPHPCPYERISILETPRGLLLRPYFLGDASPESHVQIEWGREGKVLEVSTDGTESDVDWSNGVVVHGIVGILSLFTDSYLLVISSKSDVGNFLEPSHSVFCVNGVTAIPLAEKRAHLVLDYLRARRDPDPHTSAGPTDSAADEGDSSDSASTTSQDPEGNINASAPRVTFSEQDDVKLMTPLITDGAFPQDEERSNSPISTAASTPTSEYSVNTDTVIKTLAERLSFWNKIPKRGSRISSTNQPVSQEAEPSNNEEDADEQTPLSLESIIKEENVEPGQVIDTILATAPTPPTVAEKHSQIEEKIVRDCIKEFTRGGMYFAYNFDITRSLQHKHELVAKAKSQNALLSDLHALDKDKELSPLTGEVTVLAEPSATLPLWRRVDRQFWWNEWLSRPFVDAGLHSYVLPIMQGFYQITSFSIPREPVAAEEGDSASVEYILISRRSRDRAGLRYQRRGIDDDAHVANFVETESVVRVEREGFANVFSHVQIRGSIPLFWDQQGYGLKPAPHLSSNRSHAQNLEACRRHLTRTISSYGPLVIVNLSEQHGKEAAVTNGYRDYVKELNLKDVQYHAYDFHAETKGMKYEKIAKLIEELERTFESQGYFWISNNSILSQQKSAFRVNCIDCLDRTNVVESAFARYVLNRQLGAVALLNAENIRTEMDVVFNDVWANNGDAISRAYAGTSALKGDFTRTGKRDLTGMLNDGVNSLARMYSSTFADWFSQAVIDYMLGYRTISVFSEFLVKLQSTDPKDLIHISKIRADAIATCVSRLLSDGERLLSGWTLFAPMEMNTKVGDKFEEKVLLLSVRALYIISYDYTLEKVKLYTRVPLKDIVGIQKGAYILSPLEEGSRDPLQNAGFVVTWRNTHQDTRVTSYSIRNSLDLATPPTSPALEKSMDPLQRASTRNSTLSRILSVAAQPAISRDTTFAAFKALPVDPARTRRETGSFIEPANELSAVANCKEAVDTIVDIIRQACQDVAPRRDNFVTETDVVSLAEAQRMTTVYAKMEYGVKRLLWLGG